MFDCTTDRYADLYAPWLRRGTLVDRFLARGGRVLDLCGGTGVEAVAAIKAGAQRAVLLDLNPRCDDPRVERIRGRAEEASSLISDEFDLIVCRQAMGYLDPVKVAREASRLLRGGGRFCFNTFNRPKRWASKSYQEDGTVYTEGHLFLFGRVFHLQHKEGAGSDLAVFRYHDPEVLLKAMKRYFKTVEVKAVGKSVVWTCTAWPTGEGVTHQSSVPDCTCSVSLWSGTHLPDCPRGHAKGMMRYPNWSNVPDDVLTDERYEARHGHLPPKCERGHRIYTSLGCLCHRIPSKVSA